MPKANASTNVYQLATRQDDGVATVYIYGIIGQMPEWWLPRDEQTVEEISAMALVNALNQLAKDNEVINIRINSIGGSVMEGEAMVNAIRDCGAEVHTYNDGMAASMAATIWLAGKVRHMASNAKLMLHAPVTSAYGNANELRETAEVLDKMAEASASGIAEMTGMTAEEVTERFFADGKDHWLSYKDVEEMGLIGSDTYEVAQGAPGNVEQVSYPELIQQFQAAPPRERKPSAMQRIREFAGITQRAITPQNSEVVTLQELREAVAKGDITVDQIGEIHQELAEASKPEPSMAEVIQLAVTGAVQEAMAERDATIADLRQQVQQLGSAPGAAPAGTTAGHDPSSAPAVSQVEKDARMFGNWAESGGSPFRNPLKEAPTE